MESLRPPEHDNDMQQRFKNQSLDILRQRLSHQTYPGYPQLSQRLWLDGDIELFEPLVLPDGPWETSDGELPSMRERKELADKNIRHDYWGRPLHPWFDDMSTDPDIGIVTGKGAYWNWGPNHTADAVVMRNDLAQPHVLLVERKDTGQWALPGGFIDDGEDGLAAAIRETKEETGLNLHEFQPAIRRIYEGPLADIRVTANAWPVTHAYCFVLDKESAKLYAEYLEGGDDATEAAWLPLSKTAKGLFGSHSLLVRLATRGSLDA